MVGMIHMGQILHIRRFNTWLFVLFLKIHVFPRGHLLYIRWTNMAHETRIHVYMFMGRNLNHLQNIWALPVRGGGRRGWGLRPLTGPMTYIPFDDPWHKDKNIYGLRVTCRILTFIFRYIVNANTYGMGTTQGVKFYKPHKLSVTANIWFCNYLC